MTAKNSAGFSAAYRSISGSSQRAKRLQKSSKAALKTRGPVPGNLTDVAQRPKEILYSIRTWLNTDVGEELMNLRRAAQRMLDKLPDTLCADPHVDCTPRICELVRYYLQDVTVKGAWSGPAGLDLHHHALAPIAVFPVLEVISATHLVADLTLGLGEVVHDYLRR